MRESGNLLLARPATEWVADAERGRPLANLAELVTGPVSAVPTITHTHTLMAFQCYSNTDMERMWDIGTEEEEPAF